MSSRIRVCVFIFHFVMVCYDVHAEFEMRKKVGPFQPWRTFEMRNCNNATVPCDCINTTRGIIVDCRGKVLTIVPENLPSSTIQLLLSNSSLTKIHFDSFSNLKELEILDLSYNNISSFAKGALTHLKQMKILNITMNEFLQFRNLRNVTYGLNNTSIEILAANFLHSPKHFPSTTLMKEDLLNLRNTTLYALYLDGNQIQLLQLDVLSVLPQTLRTLTVRGNDLGNIRLRDLNKYGITTMVGLTSIDISYQCNNYKLLKRVYRPKQNTYLTKMSNEKSVVCKSPGISLVGINLNLESIRARHAVFSTCIGKWNFGNLRLKYIDVSQNNLMEWIGPVTIGSPQHLIHMDLSDNNCHNIAQEFFGNLTSIQTLDLQANMLWATLNSGESKFKKLVNLQHIDLSMNGLEYIRETLFNTQYHLQTLNISRNNLKVFNISIAHMNELNEIDLSYNQIADLPAHVMHQLDQNAERLKGNVSVSLMKNPLQCTCKQLEFWNWISSSKVILNLTEYEMCKLENDSMIRLERFRSHYVRKQYANMCRSRAVLYVSITLLIMALMLILAILLYAKRWELRYRWYIYRLRRKGYTPIDGGKCDYEYDAFVSYAETDADFVKSQMITKLETEYGCNLCLHERDFRVGEKIASNIISAIHNSNRTIVVLTSAYLISNWCKYELHMANEEEYHQDRKVVVLLVLEKVNKRDLPAEVLEHYRKNTYIEYPEHEANMETFWDALRESIS